MKHVECINYINLDCEKGMCALSKQIVPIDGNDSDACGHFQAAPVCGNCACFADADKHGISICKMWCFLLRALQSRTGVSLWIKWDIFSISSPFLSMTGPAAVPRYL